MQRDLFLSGLRQFIQGRTGQAGVPGAPGAPAARKRRGRAHRADQHAVHASAVEPLEPRILLSAVDLSVAGTPMIEAGGAATVTATLSGADVVDVTVNLSFGGTATADSDYTRSALAITIPAGQLSGSITLTAIDDLLPEGGETITVNILDVVNGTLGTVTQVTAQVTDNDAAAPVAGNDAVTTNEDVAVTVNVLVNDTDANGDALTAAVVTGPANGTLTAQPDGTFTYTPNANFSGSDSFTYKANDGAADSNVATVAITVNAVNDAPAAADEAYSTNEDAPLTVAVPGVLANEADPEGDALTVSVLSGPANGTLVLNADGSFVYTPGTDFSGTDSFTYNATDAGGLSDSATVTITVVSAAQQIQNLKAAVLDLKSEGVLNKGLTNALSKKLSHTLKKLNRGQVHTSVNMLGAFTNHVEALIAGGTISTADGQPLLDAAAALEVSIATTADVSPLPKGNGKSKSKTKSNNGHAKGHSGGHEGTPAPQPGPVDPSENGNGNADSHSNNGHGKKKGMKR